MSKLTDTSDNVYRDFNTPGDPGSGVLEPVKAQIRSLFRDMAIADTPELYGAVGDGVLLDDGHIDASNPRAFSSATALFTIADVNKPIGIMKAGAAGATLLTTIAAYGDAHNITIATDALNTVTGARFAYGSDDTDALADFFADNPTGAGSFVPGKAYISTATITCSKRRLNANQSRLIFLINSHANHCFVSVPPSNNLGDRVRQRFTYDSLWLQCMATGLSAIQLTGGKPNLPGLVSEDAYTDGIQVFADGTVATPTAFENLNGNYWIVSNAGRHGIHLYLKGNASLAIQTFINETFINNFCISGVGRRFGSGGAGSASASNAMRITYDNIQGNISNTANKISSTKIIGANWDALKAGALSANAVGDTIFHNAINGTTWRRVEQFDFSPGGLESSDSVAIAGAKLITGNAFAVGDWIECDIEQGIPFNWGFGIPDVMLQDPNDGNTYNQNSPEQGSAIFRMFKARPNDTFNRAIWADPTSQAPLGPTIDYNFRNSMSPAAYSKVLVASTGVDIDIPIFSLSFPANEYTQWPLHVALSHGTFPQDQSFTTYAEFIVMLGFSQSAGTSSLKAILAVSSPSADLTKSFDPATGVAFTIQSSSGTLRDILRCTVTGGAAIGSGGALKNVELFATRWGSGISELQRLFKGGAVTNTEFGYRV